MSPGAVDLVEEEAFDRFRRLISVEAAVFDSELLCHRVGQFFHVINLTTFFFLLVLISVKTGLYLGP